ncbi:MAG TPA: SRPBCC family protein [Acidimicrobiia bacterium]|nr:SRPBCC family protein [Acidimicrobiia bacterium]
MQITQDFEVARPVASVWEMLQDVPAVAQCLPGATLSEDKGGNLYAGSISVKLGPIAATFEGEATVTPDLQGRRGSIDGRGVDKRGGSRGQVKVTYELMPSEAGGTLVSINADVTLAGPAAQFGRTGLINEMSRRLIGDFATCLEAKMAAPTEAEAQAIAAPEVKPLRLLWHSLVAWIKRLFRR